MKKRYFPTVSAMCPPCAPWTRRSAPWERRPLSRALRRSTVRKSPRRISGAALLRTVWGLFYYQSVGPLLTYNALFVPVFLVAGLGCMVMSALFRQAAEMKAENDLTI